MKREAEGRLQVEGKVLRYDRVRDRVRIIIIMVDSNGI